MNLESGFEIRDLRSFSPHSMILDKDSTRWYLEFRMRKLKFEFQNLVHRI